MGVLFKLITFTKNYYLTFGSHFTRKNYTNFLIVGFFPFCFLCLSAFLEYGVNKAGVITWMSNNFSFALYKGVITFIQFFTCGVLVAAYIRLYETSSIYRKKNLMLPITDALVIGWKKSLSIIYTLFLPWLIIKLYLYIIIIIAKILWIIYAPVNIYVGITALLIISMWAIVLPAILIGKFFFAVYLTIFHKELREFQSLVLSNKLVKFRSMFYHPIIFICGIFIFLTVFLPSFAFNSSLIEIVVLPNSSPGLIFIVQLIGAVIIFAAAPWAISIISTFYFYNSFHYKKCRLDANDLSSEIDEINYNDDFDTERKMLIKKSLI